MSTRCTLHFHDGPELAAIVFRHHDGYPESEFGVLANLETFFAESEQYEDTRFNDPTILAARFVVWQAGLNAKPGSLGFTGVRILLQDTLDIEYRYHLWCNDLDGRGRPRITYDDRHALEQENFEQGGRA